jgi:hypothetical protein
MTGGTTGGGTSTGSGTTGTGGTTSGGGTNTGSGSSSINFGNTQSQSGGSTLQPALREFGTPQTQTTTGFVGRGTTGTFIGATQPGQTGAGGFGATGGGRFGGFGGFGGGFFGGQFGRGTTQPQQPSLSRAEQLRPRHRVAFDYQPIETAAVTTNLRTHLQPVSNRVSGVQVEVDPQGRAILRGAAASEDARRLAEALARLEPGVRSVDNQITVATPTVAPVP